MDNGSLYCELVNANGRGLRKAKEDTAFYKELGARIRESRKRECMSQATLAERMGESQNTIARWETGQYRPSIKALVGLCSAFGVTAGYFLPMLKREKTLWRVVHPAYGTDTIVMTSYIVEAESPKEALKKYNREVPKHRWPIANDGWQKVGIDSVYPLVIHK